MTPTGRWFTLCTLVAIAGIGAAAFAEESPSVPFATAAADTAAWRLDLLVTVGPDTEIVAAKELIEEPLPWPGPPSAWLDGAVPVPESGVVRLELRDAEGRPWFTRGSSPLWTEWTTTEAARHRHRVFEDSLRFPRPSAPSTLILRRRAADGQFDPILRLELDPDAGIVDPAGALPPRRFDGPGLEPIELEVNGPPHAQLDLLFVGDGYTAEECTERFESDARRMLRALFAKEPFGSRRSDLSVRGLCPPARRSGITRPSDGRWRVSPVGSRYGVFGFGRYLLALEEHALRRVAASAPYEILVVLANADSYGGGGLYGGHAAVAVGTPWADYVLLHELGHHIAGLADEYYVAPVAYAQPDQVIEPWEPNVTALLDGSPPWSEKILTSTPVPTPWPQEAFDRLARSFQERRAELRAADRPEEELSTLFTEQRQRESELLSTAEHAGAVGAFRGANYDARAFYRSEIDCIMFSRNDVPFSSVCADALESVIDLHAGTRPAASDGL
ncbi:MAG: M64 family metallopeptidase [Acidobacteriota bacterium]